MIIFGTTGITTTPEKGDFHCPTCQDKQPYKFKRVRRFFTLYFIPVIPLNKVGEYVECGKCKDTYNTAVLEFDPEKIHAQMEAEYQLAIKEVMLRIMLADGVIDEAEIEMMQSIYERIVGSPISPESIRSEIEKVKKSDRELNSYLESLQGALNEEGKETVLAAALFVAFSDGVFQEEEQKMIMQIGKSLGMTDAHIRGVIGSLLAEADEEEENHEHQMHSAPSTMRH